MREHIATLKEEVFVYSSQSVLLVSFVWLQ